MRRMNLFLMMVLALCTEQATAGCVCRCMNGDNVPLCSSSLDLPPICPPRVCPIAPPAVEPLAPLRLPPLGTSDCRQQQVLNPYTGRYEWRTVCR